MIEDKISIRYFDKSQKLEIIEWSPASFDYVEQLIYNVLKSLGVKPIYRAIFGLRVTDRSVWLAPNLTRRELLKLAEKLSGEAKFELRMRFRPSSYKNLLIYDVNAFDLIFAQIRHDFMRDSRFENLKKGFVLLDDPVINLIALELLRYAIENEIETDEILKQAHLRDFIPRSASNWQRRFMNYIAEDIHLQKTVHFGYDICDRDSYKLKRNFIELFLNEVAQDYACEVYNVVQILNFNDDKTGRDLEIRVRFSQTTENQTHCHIDVRPRPTPTTKKDKPSKIINKAWESLCDIGTISRGTLRANLVQVTLSNNFAPLKFRFESVGHAQSFVSCVDGYYRLMRKWNFNLCREVISPELEELKRMDCHGPIGYESTSVKLAASRKAGSFLVRKCMDYDNKFLIDTILLKSDARLIIEVEWNPESKLYRLGDHSVTKEDVGITISTDQEEFSCLKNLVEHTQIWVDDDDRSYPQQLKHWLLPDECDDYPALLLSISDRKVTSSEHDNASKSSNSISDLPKIIPPQMLHILPHTFEQAGLSPVTLRLASLNQEREVVLKTIDGNQGGTNLDPMVNRVRFHFCPEVCKIKTRAASTRPLASLVDWMFIRHHCLAETIGLDINSSLIQEYFPLGPLDKFLQQNSTVSAVVKLSISLQLAEVLVFLQERSLIHGKLRCRSFFVRQEHPIHVKLVDPMGPFDCYLDQAFIAPEYIGATGELCVKQFESGIDVWALGTTLWQIYNDGVVPAPGVFANTLLQPLACPDEVWSVIESCWTLNANARASPQAILRDLNDLFAWVDGAHEYYHIQKQMELECTSNNESPQDSPSKASSTSCEYNSMSDQTVTSQSTTLRAGSDGSESSSLRGLIRGGPTIMNKSRNISMKRNTLRGSILETDLIVGNQLSDKKFSRQSWKGLVDGWRVGTHGLLGRKNFYVKHFSPSKIDFSELSLNSCSTPSDSGVAKDTELLDIEGVSDAVDRCVWHVESTRLRLGPEIGRGTSGVVIKGVLAQENGEGEKVVAVKRIEKNNSNGSFFSNFCDIKKEFDVLKKLDHKNIIKILGYADVSSMMLIFEYMPLGSLLCYIKNYHHNDLHTLPLRKYAQDIASGMEYLERERIVHRDLALRNILVENQNEVKICDFGLARWLEQEDFYSMKTERALPLKWYAPETLLTWRFTHKSDVWSYGVVLWELYSGGSSPQYSTGTYALELARTLEHERLPMPRDCPLQMYDLMLKCWAYDPQARESFSHIKEELTEQITEEPEFYLETDESVSTEPLRCHSQSTTPSE